VEQQNIIQAINDCRAGNMDFNNGENLYCFLYEKTWFPLRAIVNQASQLANENIVYTKNDALVKMHELFDYVKVKQVNVQNDILVNLTTEEKFEEIEKLSKMIHKLTNREL
jgi:hypothetical protein